MKEYTGILLHIKLQTMRLLKSNSSCYRQYTGFLNMPTVTGTTEEERSDMTLCGQCNHLLRLHIYTVCRCITCCTTLCIKCVFQKWGSLWCEQIIRHGIPVNVLRMKGPPLVKEHEKVDASDDKKCNRNTNIVFALEKNALQQFYMINKWLHNSEAIQSSSWICLFVWSLEKDLSCRLSFTQELPTEQGS